MGDYVLKYTLKQDSPMIHFQGKTPGAALRPSEVKPKLDRFLKEWCKRNKKWCGENDIDISEKAQKRWKADQTHEAYDYKMRIHAGETQGVPNNNLPSYFGKLEDFRTNLRQENIGLEILCFHKELREIIKEAIETFFVLHNFGTRQNRGIGGFTLKETTPERAEKLLVEWFGKQKITVYKMEFEENTDPVKILNCGNMFYQILKSGINYYNGKEEIYIKSFLTKYFLDKGIGGEKRWMKEQGISPVIVRAGRPKPAAAPIPAKGYRFIRGLLGTTGNIRYQAGTKNGKIIWENVAISSKELARVPSPIRYKIVGNVLFIIPLPPEEEIYNKRFTFRNKGRYVDNNRLNTPKAPEFTMDELMKGYMEYLRNDIPNEIVKYAGRKNIGITLPTLVGNQWIQICKGETT